MAAAPEHRAPEVVDLSRLSAGALDELLAEEQLAWRVQLHWDFSASADLVKRFLSIHALNGYALVASGKVIGYSYFVAEESKGLVGDLYVLRDWAQPENEDTLLSAVLHSLISTPGVERIEAQLMMLHGTFERAAPFGLHGSVFPRLFMLADLDAVQALPPFPLNDGIAFEPWENAREEETARLIAAAYREHVDSSINDQYRSAAGARRFLHNVIHYPGCGSFFAPGSMVAVTPDGRVAGVVLSSRVAPETGHITQICVAPERKGQGLGYELMRRSLAALGKAGCTRTSLTVTADNRRAVALYQRLGFRAVKRFAAYVWEGF